MIVIGAKAVSAAAIWNRLPATVRLPSCSVSAETENFLRQHDDAAHLRTIYFDVREE